MHVLETDIASRMTSFCCFSPCSFRRKQSHFPSHFPSKSKLSGHYRLHTMSVMVVYVLLTTLLAGSGQQAWASDTCPAEYQSCNWECPSLPERCPGDRDIADPCGCCTVCMRQAGEMCSTPKRPCDAGFELNCVNGRCKGMYNCIVKLVLIFLNDA